MTNPDPWAAAAATPVATAPPATAPAASSNLAGSYAAPAPAQSSLFSKGEGNWYPALFNKTHAPGTEFSGIILNPPKDVHSYSFPRQPGDPRLPQYWCDNGQGKRLPGTQQIDPATGKPNDPVMDLLIELQTEDRFTPDQLTAIGRDATFVDDGKRALQVSGSKRPKGHVPGQPTNGMRAVLDALEAAVAAGLQLTDDEALVGCKLTVRRVERLQPGVTTSPWTYVARLEKA